MADKQHLIDYSDLILEWDWDSNNAKGLNPHELLPRSNKKACWICRFGHTWEAVIASRTEQKTGCPICSGRTILPGYNDLATKNPLLAAEWDYSKNERLSPNTISPNKREKVWWICSKCGYNWIADIHSRNHNGVGCPACGKKKQSNSQRSNRIKERGSLAQNNPDLAKEWHPEKNGELTPEDVLTGSNTKVWWLGKCGHEWKAVVSSRTQQKTGCPICSGRTILPGYNDLATKNPLLAAEWDHSKNEGLSPNTVSPNRHEKVWWICSKCGNNWIADIHSRNNNGVGCPECGKKKLSNSQRGNRLKERGSLAQNNPDLAKEWHPEKNGELTPEDVLTGSNIKVWWLGKCGHEWQAVISSRNVGNGCPVCGFKQSAITRNKQKIEQGMSLQDVNPQLAGEWHPSRNGMLKAKDVLPGSGEKVWWQCRKGHEWQAVISSRSAGVGCPICGSEKHTSFPEQAILFYFSQFFEVENRYKFKGREIDIFIPSKNIGIEYDGRFFHGTEKARIKDEKKMQYLESQGVSLYRIKEGTQNSVEGRIVFFRYDSLYSELPWAIHTVAQFVDNSIQFDINLKRDRYSIYEQYIHLEKKNSIVLKYPKVADEWNYDRNGKTPPEAISYSSNKSFWWKCKQGHEWQAVVSSRTKGGTSCPYCSGRLAIKGVSDLATTNPVVAQEWLYAKNEPLKPTQVSEWSNKVVWWKCSVCGYEWRASIGHRSRGRGCPICAKDKQKKTYRANKIAQNGSLKTKRPDLAEEWHPTNNGSLSPEDVLTGTNEKVWWLGKCGHQWQATVSSRANQNTGCPICSGHQILSGFNDLKTKNPFLAAEWDYSKNLGLSPSYISPNSDKKVWWKCSLCGNQWDAVISSRNSGVGCPQCGNKKLGNSQRRRMIHERGSLEQTAPQLAKEWHPTKNGQLTPKDIMSGSKIRVWWLSECGHEWEATVYDRTKGVASCPYCSNKRVIEGETDLATTNPTLASEWLYSKNKPLTPNQVSEHSVKTVWWRGKCGHEWEAKIRDRAFRKQNCPFCSGHRVLVGFNDLASNNPTLVKEWDYEKNESLSPESVSPGSNKKVWWKCIACGNRWAATISSRNAGNGCPNCRRGKIAISHVRNALEKRGSLFDNNPEIAQEWHPSKNGSLTPHDVLVGSNRRVWWLGKCGHEWETLISSRALSHTGCPICSGRIVLPGYNDLLAKNPLLAFEWNYEKNGGKRPEEVYVNTNEKYWWVCSTCGKEWEASVSSRNSWGHGCPVCSRTKQTEKYLKNRIVKKGSLKETNEDLAKEWHPTKNGVLTADDVVSGSNKKVWWLGNCGHEWEAVVSSRALSHTGCPICSGRKILSGFNDLGTKNPRLAAEWDYSRNVGLSPETISPNSHKKAWWICSNCRHQWMAEIHSRNSGVGCPICRRKWD